MGMRLGFTIKPDISVERIVALTRSAEAAGFEYGWMFDSHILWKEPFPLLALMASNNKTLRLGTCVTNPAARDVTITASLFATLDLISVLT
jgi:alkanesulfonate monooxygenase SsuD/methylene tetrahydromethanopterin reductase-like flavin-dependent oxidoreductase (luciferase family)